MLRVSSAFVIGILATLIGLGALTGPAVAELRPEFSTTERLMQWTFDYRDRPRPERLPEAVQGMYELGLLRDEEKSGYFVGFIAGILHNNPKNASRLVARMIPLPAREQGVLIRAVAYSRLPDWPMILMKYAPQMEARKLLIDEFLAGQKPDLLEAPFSDGATLIYTLWGFFVATGDVAPVARVIEALALAEGNGEDPLSWASLSASLGFDDGAVVRTRFERLVVASTAKWTLVSYAEHHRDLLDVYRAELARGPAPEIAVPLGDALAAAERFEADRVRRAEAEVVEAMRQKVAASGDDGSRAAYAGSVGIATACVVAGAVGLPQIAIPCVVTGALYQGTMKILEQP